MEDKNWIPAGRVYMHTPDEYERHDELIEVLRDIRDALRALGAQR